VGAGQGRYTWGVLRALLPAALALGLLAGCGEDERAAPELGSGRLVVLDWARADPAALCETEAAARGRTGRSALRTRDAPSGQECWVAIRRAAPLATRADVRAVVRTPDGREELRFTDVVRRRLVALGTDAHVGVVHDGRLLDVVFPQGGTVRVAVTPDAPR